MKVKDLIHELSKLDPELMVVTPDCDGYNYQKAVTIRKGVFDGETEWLYSKEEFMALCKEAGVLLKGQEAVSVEWH